MSRLEQQKVALKASLQATVIGEESGGGFQGNNSGMMPVTRVPPGFIFTMPLQKYTTAVDTTLHLGRGTPPDHPLYTGFRERLSGRDTETEQALHIIRQSR